jgi:putative phosphoserine phosphatase/1-acylglycerol-3-phosphate O-acyltransferase
MPVVRDAGRAPDVARGGGSRPQRQPARALRPPTLWRHAPGGAKLALERGREDERAMSLYPELTREIENAPPGPRIGAFFDLDRTLIAGFSALNFVLDGVRNGRIGAPAMLELLAAAASFQLGTVGFSGFMTGTARTLRGYGEEEFAAVGESIFNRELAAEIYPEARAIVEAHRRRGHSLAVVSSATSYQVAPIARELGIEHVLTSQLEVVKGVLTGEVLHPTCYGPGKAHYARELAERAGVDLEQSWFYTDSEEDLPLLDIVGNPRPTNPTKKLQQIAARRGWPARHFVNRGYPGLAEILRTGLALGSLVPSFLLGLPAAIASGDWRRAINLSAATWGELATVLAGVEVRVTGEEHLWSHRPAVFIFNHQSGLDMLLVCKLLRRDFVGIAKKELQRNPIFGPFMSLAGTVFIDRFNHERAIEALQPAIDALRQGLSLAIAPEGTRSTTLHPNRFKKGAFYMAMAAGVPIVPIVLRNTMDALPKNWVTVRPATIDVVVLPPVDTRDWTRQSLNARVAEIERRYAETLLAGVS